MSWFNRSHKHETEAAHDVRVEVVVNKEATKEVVEEAKAANQHLAKLLQENHFTIKIYRAAGGNVRKARVR